METHNIEGTVTVEFDLKDWVWLCELLSEITQYPESDPVLQEDSKRALSALTTMENSI